MLNLLDDFIKKLNACKTVKQADQYLFDFLLNDSHCKNFVYTGYAKDYRTSHQLSHQLFTPDVKAWHQYYVDHHFEDIDPIGASIRSRNVPFIWRNEALLKEVAPHQRVIYEASIQHGFSNGLSIPMHGEKNDFAILLIHENAIDAYLAERSGIVYVLQMAAMYYYDTITQLMKANLVKNLVEPLTGRELECLAVSAQGLTAKEVAEKLEITPRTVSFHLENATQKLGVRNKAQAILKAKELGIIM